MPIITSDTFAKKELVSEGETGFLINLPRNWSGYGCMDEKVLTDFFIKTDLLINNKKIREKMSKNAVKSAKEKFSIKRRNDFLKKIYLDALN